MNGKQLKEANRSSNRGDMKGSLWTVLVTGVKYGNFRNEMKRRGAAKL